MVLYGQTHGNLQTMVTMEIQLDVSIYRLHRTLSRIVVSIIYISVVIFLLLLLTVIYSYETVIIVLFVSPNSLTSCYVIYDLNTSCF